jgi:tetratricopeptide (TPR) repeat protein
MKNRMFIIAVILSAVLCWPASWSIENPGIGNPVGPSTIPPSTFRSSLVNNPDPIDTSGNLLITGNVRRGRHFRGDVPYRSPTSFGSNLGSSSLSSFLRDTAGSEDLQTHSNKYGTQPYYSLTETVTTMAPGRSEIFMPERTRASTRAQQNTRSEGTGLFGSESMQQEQALFGQGAAAADSGLQGPATQYGQLAQSRLMLESKFPTSMSLSPQGTERLTPSQIGIRRQGQTSAAELFKEQVQDIRDRTQSTRWPSPDSTTVPGSEFRESQWEKNESFKFPSQETNIENLRPKFEMQTPPQNRDGDGKQIAFAHQGISALEQSTSSMDSTSQKNLFMQKDANWSATSREFQTGQGQTAAGTFGTLESARGDTSGLTGAGQDRQQSDVLERIRQQLEDLTKSLDATIQSRDAYKDVNAEPVAKREQMPLGYQQYVPDSRQAAGRERINSSGTLNYYKPQATGLGFNGEELAPAAGGGLNRTGLGRQTGLEFTGIPNYENPQKKSSPLDELNKLSQADISAEANLIMGRYKSLDSLSESKFNQHMLDAEEHLKAGRYYRAASCFSLASVYQADNPLALAGRGHALFAAGEYVSSALFLSRALAINPEYLQMRVDLVAMLGDGNKLAGRIADIEQWLARSGSSQLQFLLGYVYYRTGQLLRAKQAIDAAYEKTPESPAIQAMKITIDNMTMRR